MGTPLPNLLFVFADQLQGAVLGCAGHPTVQTPHLDRLVQEGLRCTRAIANCPLCTPSRATMLSGRYPLSHQAVSNWLPLPEPIPTFGEALRDGGWRTGYIGKWHLDGVEIGFTPPGPRRHGFEFWAALNTTITTGHHYFDGIYYRDQPEPIQLQGYEPDGQTDLAIAFMEEHRAAPWALFLSWGPPHHPYHLVPAEYRQRYDPAHVWVPPNAPHADRRAVADYYAAVTALDWNVGRLLDAVDALGLRSRTLVLFTSDHGDMLFAHELREKHQPYEESIWIPLLARFPGVLPEGETYDGLVSTADLLPTLLTLLGCSSPPGVEGVDLAGNWRAHVPHQGPESAFILGPVPDHPRRANLPWQEWRGVRTLRYTYAESLYGPWLLFDNEVDPYQLHNLVASGAHAAALEDCRRQLREWLERTHDSFLPWRDLLRRMGLQELWNARERLVHEGREELL